MFCSNFVLFKKQDQGTKAPSGRAFSQVNITFQQKVSW